MIEQSLNSVLMNEQSVGLVKPQPIYDVLEFDIVMNDNQLNINGEHLTAEPELASVHHYMSAGVSSGHVVCDAQGPYYNVDTVSEGSSITDGSNGTLPFPWANTHGMDRTSLFQNAGAHFVENSQPMKYNVLHAKHNRSLIEKALAIMVYVDEAKHILNKSQTYRSLLREGLQLILIHLYK